MFKKIMNALQVSLSAILIFQLVGCGTIMYPERKGQKSGKIDAGIAVLDGVGLLFFLIPGIIAFAVDFNNGTIYLPGTSRSSLDLKTIKQISFDARHTDKAGVEKIIKEQTGHAVKLDQSDMRITQLKSTDDMMAQFAQTLSEVQDDRIVFVR